MTEQNKLSKRQIALDAVAGGSTPTEAAAIAGVKVHTVHNYCHEEGLSVLPRATDDVIAEALDLVRTGHTYKAAARLVGWSEHAVRKWARKYL